jgi:glyoxalase family protein
MNGLHHVTAIAGKPARNLGFYSQVLGLRLVKKTVNFDDPGTYHLYYGDELGHPGTILTFFPWETADSGQVGIGMAQEIAFRVPASSIGHWSQRFIEKGVAYEAPEKRFGETRLPFRDPDGLRLALVGDPAAEEDAPWTEFDIAPENAIRGFHSVTLLLSQARPTSDLLGSVFGYEFKDRENSLLRFEISHGGQGRIIDIREVGGFLAGRMGTGAIHHIAFRATDDAEQTAMAYKVRTQHALHPTQQIDRQYFRSVYFREPGGVLFEIATDEPGFAVDEPAATLGASLKLPPFLEPRRREIEASLPPLSRAA